MFYRPWNVHAPDAAQSQMLSGQTGLPRLVCDVLRARGKTTAEDVKRLLGEDEVLSDPMLLLNMEKAVDRILHAVDNEERIVVFGDYDVDGVTATALLYTYLNDCGAEVYYKLPNRDDEGYGLSEDVVEMLARKGVSLIITVDNGVSAYGPIARAKELGIDVVVTDHHLPPDTLPDAAAVVDPQLPGDESPCKSLCGAGVAFKLVAALNGCSAQEMLAEYGDLTAIGTIADIMVLEGENRALVKAGLAQLQNTRRPGLAALIESCGLADKEITAENVSFGLSPRLNAAGRMDSATDALELLLCEDMEEAQERVASLEAQNVARQKAEQEITQCVLDAIEADETYRADRILVVAGERFHPGVIGIVASRIVERFGKPAIIISIDETGEGKGSGRSLANLSLYHAIAACSDCLIRYGGHALAAGLSVTQENIPTLRKKINEWAAEEHPVPQHPALELDAPLMLAHATPADVAQLSVLAPFGHGNPAPLFCLENAVIEAVYPVSDGKHSRLRLRQGNASLYAVLFGCSPERLCYAQGDAVDVALSVSVYDGKLGETVSGRIKEIRPADLGNAFVEGAQLFEALSCGARLTREQRSALLPTREDTAQVYRAVTGAPHGLPADDLRPLFQRLGEKNSGKILVSLRALEQLALIAQTEDEHGARRYMPVPQQGKKDLSSAPVLHQLEEE